VSIELGMSWGLHQMRTCGLRAGATMLDMDGWSIWCGGYIIRQLDILICVLG